MKFNVGDRCKVIKEGSHGFKVGEIVTITEKFCVDNPFLEQPYVAINKEGATWYMFEDELVLLDETPLFNETELLGKENKEFLNKMSNDIVSKDEVLKLLDEIEKINNMGLNNVNNMGLNNSDIKETDRKFEYVSRIKDKEFSLPKRSTSKSAGYDFFVPEDTVCKSHEITMVKTGVKAYFPDNETLLLFNRSSNPKKKGLIILNRSSEL